ncbi:leucine-rich melanocyte differentiation-associated protein-like isoform X1 [Anastrepha obliqua]|uniref:leucine-rich melanocyte differentiation-associated protein-like isoform X1 n=2 Tax=Anastrepha obliqua TaxID=95512 RepID=UPI0024091952|nr:leucine-rich melanocyte differentiation-associated protein-like isoform X1 [Anastrepha obliqua]XP_054736655.1 leucine-rich melanocyte differentiation-associated protein-like isoform X1 [Anastrepha obliqua]
MSDADGILSRDNSENQQLFSVLKSCANLEFYDDYCEDFGLSDYNFCVMQKIISVSGNISTSSFASDDSIGDNILEENGRISLAYENLRTIPGRIAEKFNTHTKCLDLSYNRFENLSFLSFFDELDTLILDRNCTLDVNTLPFLANIKILWINNCNISNMVEWIHRIQTHCPSLEHLSMMGNPGVNNEFVYSMSSTQKATCQEMPLPPADIINYRECIFNSLPQLKTLDGVARDNKLLKHQEVNFTYSSTGNSPVSSSSSNKLGKDERNQQIHPTPSFGDLFQINKKRKKVYQMSSKR